MPLANPTRYPTYNPLASPSLTLSAC